MIGRLRRGRGAPPTDERTLAAVWALVSTLDPSTGEPRWALAERRFEQIRTDR